MRMPTCLALVIPLALSWAPAVPAQSPVRPSAQSDIAWVEKSNVHAKLMIDLVGKLSPEEASKLGVEGFDDQILDLSPGFVERQLKAMRKVHAELVRRLPAETDPRVKQDLEILIKAAADRIKRTEAEDRILVPYLSLSQLVHESISGLLDDRVARGRWPAAVVRLRKYAGMEPGTKPITDYAMAHVRERISDPKLVRPVKAQVEKDLRNARTFIDEVGELFVKFKIEGFRPACEKLKQQLAAWDEFVKDQVLPIARDDFRMPAELYELTLERVGIDIPPAELARMARRAFAEIQGQMQETAAQVAHERRLPRADYRDVIKTLKKEQLVGEAILGHYEKRLKEIEEIIRDRQIVTLPTRPVRIRLANPAEAAANAVPNFDPPRLLGNKGEVGVFVLPRNDPDPQGGVRKFDDFTYAAVSWALTAHETRPGHELQYALMLERGVSQARAVFADNSTNIEGWGLYSEWLMEPYEPAEGRLICYQLRLLRAARAFLDIELQTGKTTREKALALLRDDVVLSDAMANDELERYTFDDPGQANAYFYGYTRLRELRNEVERSMAGRFSARAFHDFILAQGLIPPHLLRKAVLEEFVGK